MINSPDSVYSARTSQRKIYTNLSAVAASLNRINITSLVSLSTVTMTKSNTIFVISSFDSGSLIIKSIDTELHGLLGTCNSCNNLYSLYRGVFIL